MTAIADWEKQTKILEVFIPEKYDVVSVLSALITEYNLEVEILLANLATKIWEYQWLDRTSSLKNESVTCYVHFVKIKLLGNNQQLFQSLSYLTGLGIKLKINRHQSIDTKVTQISKPSQLHRILAA